MSTARQEHLYPKDTWITIPTAQLDTEFFLPVWVDEGIIRYISVRLRRTLHPTSRRPSANLDLAHHVATDIEPVEVIGRVYDFHITDIADYNWETVFRKQKGMRYQAARPIGQDFAILTVEHAGTRFRTHCPSHRASIRHRDIRMRP